MGIMEETLDDEHGNDQNAFLLFGRVRGRIPRSRLMIVHSSYRLPLMSCVVVDLTRVREIDVMVVTRLE
jgi:hypothetical protein